MREALLARERDHILFVAREQVRLRRDPISDLRAYCRNNKHQFVALNNVSGGIASLPGIIACENGVDRILMASSTFDRVCGGAAAANLAKEDLLKQGLILVTGTGVHRRFAVKRGQAQARHQPECRSDGVKQKCNAIGPRAALGAFLSPINMGQCGRLAAVAFGGKTGFAWTPCIRSRARLSALSSLLSGGT